MFCTLLTFDMKKNEWPQHAAHCFHNTAEIGNIFGGFFLWPQKLVIINFSDIFARFYRFVPHIKCLICIPSLQFCFVFLYTHEYTYTTVFAWATQTRFYFKLIAYDSRTNAICIYDCTFYVASFTIVHAAQHTTKLCHVCIPNVEIKIWTTLFQIELILVIFKPFKSIAYNVTDVFKNIFYQRLKV